jgi:hypothetical protein
VWRVSTLHSSGAKEIPAAAKSINIWPRCGQAARRVLLLEFRDRILCFESRLFDNAEPTQHREYRPDR